MAILFDSFVNVTEFNPPGGPFLSLYLNYYFQLLSHRIENYFFL